MSDAPERTFVQWPHVNGAGLAFSCQSRPPARRTEYIRSDIHAAEIAALQSRVAELEAANRGLVRLNEATEARAEAAEAALARAYMAGRDDAAKVIKATAHILAGTGYEAFSNRINQIADGVLDLPVPADLAKRLGVSHE